MLFSRTISNVFKEANSIAGYGLDPQFAETLSVLLSKCRAAGLDFRIAQGLRTPQTQARYYCSWAKRSPRMIDADAKKMERDGAPWLASVLRAYRKTPRRPDWLTSALPGAGWHQWGLAADCYCYRNGEMVRDGSDPVYKFYADEARRLGLTAGYYFKRQDSGHVQGPSANGATDVYTWPYIDGVMKERFGEKEAAALSPDDALERVVFTAKTLALAPDVAPLRESVAIEAARSFYKDDPVLRTVRLEPEFVYELPSANSRLKRMAQTYNAIGGLCDALAQRLGIDPVAVLAVWYVESGGRSFTPGYPVLRFENHKFFKYWGADHERLFDKHFRFGGHAGASGKAYQNHKFRNKPNQAWRSVHIDRQEREYEVFALGESLGGREAASLASSFGGPQIMGFNHGDCGYSSAVAMADAFGTDNRWQVLGFYDFCKTQNLIDEIIGKRWFDFARGYNGKNNVNVYGPRIRDAFNERQALLSLPKVPNPVEKMMALVAMAPTLRTEPKKRKPVAKPKAATAKRKRGRAKKATSTRSTSRRRKAA